MGFGSPVAVGLGTEGALTAVAALAVTATVGEGRGVTVKAPPTDDGEPAVGEETDWDGATGRGSPVQAATANAIVSSTVRRIQVRATVSRENVAAVETGLWRRTPAPTPGHARWRHEWF